MDDPPPPQPDPAPDGAPTPAPDVPTREEIGTAEAVDRRIRAVAHDFNHFLTAIVGSLELALEELPPDSPVAEDLRLALRSADRASALTGDLVARDAAQQPGERTIDLVGTLRDTAGVLNRLAGDGVRLALELPDHPVPVRIETSRVERMLLNLVVNARDAIAGPGTIDIGLRVGDGGRDGQAVIEVSDDGEGMDDEQREAVFERSFTTKGSGAGLGLAIVRRIVEDAGGGIEVESAVGAGTTFRLRLPLSDGRRGRAGPAGAKEPGSGARVLVASRDPGEREIVGGALRRRGYQPLSAADAAAAHELLDAADTAPRLLVTDVGRSDPEGFGLADALRRRNEDAAVVFVTGDPVDELTDRRSPAPREVFLERPFSVEALLSAVRRATGRRGSPAGGARERA